MEQETDSREEEEGRKNVHKSFRNVGKEERRVACEKMFRHVRG